MWQASMHQMLGSTSSISDQSVRWPHFLWEQRANNSILLGGLVVFGWLRAHSWHFDILDILVSLSKHLPLISLIESPSLWDWEWFQVHLCVILHLVAHEDHCGCGVLITLGGCRHLDGLEQRWSCGKSWWLFLDTSSDLVRGVVPFLVKWQRQI